MIRRRRQPGMDRSANRAGRFSAATALGAIVAAAASAAALADVRDRPPSPALPLRSDAAVDAPRGDVFVVLGAEGTTEYGATFGEWAALWEAAANRGGCRFHRIGDLVGDASSNAAKHNLQALLASAAKETSLPLWIVFIGHGTFDGRAAKFNLLGEDVSADELAGWLSPLQRPVAVLQCASSSGPFLSSLSSPRRVVVTSTKSGGVVNFSRFGGFLAAALVDPAADVDKDLQVSLLEAYLHASRLTEEYYTGDNRIATEHALLDDNGDQLGTRAAAFSGVRPVREATSGESLDGYTAHQWLLIPSAEVQPLTPRQEQRRRELEVAVLQLRERKGSLPPDDYYAELETLLVELARVSLSTERTSHRPSTGQSGQTPQPMSP